METITPEMLQALEQLTKTVGIWQQDILQKLSECEIESWVQYAVMGRSIPEIASAMTKQRGTVNPVSKVQIARQIAAAQTKIISNIIGREDVMEFLQDKPELQCQIDALAEIAAR